MAWHTSPPTLPTIHGTRSRDGAEASCVAGELALLTSPIRAHADLAADLLHEDYSEYGQSGRIYDRAGILDHLADDALDLVAEQVEAQRLADNVVLVLYVAVRGEARSNRTSVWVRCDDGRWRMRHHQGTATTVR